MGPRVGGSEGSGKGVSARLPWGDEELTLRFSVGDGRGWRACDGRLAATCFVHGLILGG